MSLKINAFLLMNGRAQEAIDYYQEVFEAELIFKQTVGQAPEEDRVKLKYQENEFDLISHSVLKIEDMELFIADKIPALPFREGSQVSICITVKDQIKAKRFYERLQKQGNTVMELGETYFSPAYGIVTDRFGVTFQIFVPRQK